jgi:hypothetical protein
MIKALSAVAIVTAALATPVFAQDDAVRQKPIRALRHDHGTAYNQVQQPAFAAPRAPVSGSYFDNESIDRSRIGGHDPDFNPPS